jgi:DNA repair protein RadC
MGSWPAGRSLEQVGHGYDPVHNRPRSDPKPSREDVEKTRAIQQAATALSIAVHDHIIIGNGRSLTRTGSPINIDERLPIAA